MAPQPPAGEPSSGIERLDPAGLFDLGLDAGARPADREPWVAPSVDEVAALLPQYEVTKLIGQGGMGAVYEGRQSALGRRIALKLLPARLATEPGFAERFRRESRTLAQLQHPGIVAVYDSGQTAAGHLYFVMEYVDGTDLQRILHTGRVSPDQALELIVQICEALHYAHTRGVVHRDIKPANVLLDQDGRVKLADFGLARPPPEQAAPITESNVIMGTADYMAPEQRTGHADPRTDIYALGVMLYEMLTGQRPHGVFDPPSRKVQVDIRLDSVVLKALQEQPERRYQQASEMKTDVDHIRTTPHESAPAEPARHLPVAGLRWAGIAALLIVLAVAAAIFLRPAGVPVTPPAPIPFEQRVQRIILPVFALNNAPLREAIDVLKREARERDPEKKGVNFVVRELPGGIEKPATIRLTNVPLTEAVRYLADLTGLKVELVPDAEAFVFTPMPPADDPTRNQLYTREWRPTEEWLQSLVAENRTTGHIQTALVANGLTFPKGASMLWLPASGKLVMRNTGHNLDLLKTMIAVEPASSATAPRAPAKPSTLGPTRIGTDSDWQSIAAGVDHALALKTDGSLWAWGANASGQLGVDSPESQPSPVRVGSDRDWAKIFARGQASFAIKVDGGLWVWGRNHYGKLGDGTDGDRHSPTRIGTDTEWVSVAPGAYHTMALKSDGSAWGWGANHLGQMGDGTTAARFAPQQIGNDQDWIALRTGYGFVMGLKADGTLWGWGDNGRGQLGSDVPVQVRLPTRIGPDRRWSAIEARNNQAFAMARDGTLWACGSNQYGQLGFGSTSVRSDWVQAGTATDWKVLAATGREQTFALKTDGSLWAWGRNHFGQLGDGTRTDRAAPVQIGADSDWVAISPSDHGALGLKRDGSIWGWGIDF